MHFKDGGTRSASLMVPNKARGSGALFPFLTGDKVCNWDGVFHSMHHTILIKSELDPTYLVAGVINALPGK